MSTVFSPPPAPTLAIDGSELRFPVRRLYCVGRNYAAHAREMGKDPDREPPFFFSKPADAVVESGQDISYPPQTADLHHEGELAVCLGHGGRDVSAEDATALIWGYAIANDLTRRDMQAEAKKLGRPWDLAKGFDHSAAIGPVHHADAAGSLNRGAIRTYVNGALRQDGDLSEMIWSVPEIIAALSRSIALLPGDVILTGTPAGVGALARGDSCAVEIAGLGRIENRIV
ncbi:fumarylacetoacetate hydrolase family protein [Litorisediminicola beolgyonensis]|uniref:Fumarylacetoacetate hydrolase family protein n=1 Tax=Litorisediminicola beolgyonensis TaxID=1173614 RepID=A0ABW3ZD34_9RHOB